MPHPEKDIEFVTCYRNHELRLKTYRNEYADLRNLLIAKIDPQGFGECGGMGRCATCLVQISDKANSNVIRPTLYLSCQVNVDDALANVSVKII